MGSTRLTVNLSAVSITSVRNHSNISHRHAKNRVFDHCSNGVSVLDRTTHDGYRIRQTKHARRVRHPCRNAFGFTSSRRWFTMVVGVRRFPASFTAASGMLPVVRPAMSTPRIDERWGKRRHHEHEPFPVRRRVRIPVHGYWLWVVIFFGFLAVVPWHATQKMPSEPVAYLPLGAYNHWFMFNWQLTLIFHVLVAVCLATVAAATQTVTRRVSGESEHVTYGLRQLLTVTCFLALILGLLAWHAAPPAVLGAVVLSFSGWPTAIVLSGLVSRRIMARRAIRASKVDS